MDEPLVFSITFFFFLILLRISLVIHGGLGRGRKEEEEELIIYFETCKNTSGSLSFFLVHVISKQLLCHLRRPFCVCESLSSTTFSMSCSVNEANLEVMFLLLH